MLSINTRMSLAAGTVLIIFIGLTGYVLDNAFRDSALTATKDRLQGQLYLLMGAAEVNDAGSLTMPLVLQEGRFNIPRSGLYASIRDLQGDAVWQSTSAASLDFNYPAPGKQGELLFEKIPGINVEYHVLSMTVNWAIDDKNHLFTFYVAEDVAPYVARIQQYRQSLWFGLGITSALLLVVQLIVLRWGLWPLRSVATELRAIEDGKQDTLENPYPRELATLTDNLNALLVSERAQRDRYRNALADLAHSLKTPLAVMRAALGSKDQSGLAQTTTEQVEQLDRIVNYQLQKAATKGSRGLSTPVSLKPLIERLCRTLSKVNHDKPVQADVVMADNLVFRGDEEDLTEMLGNLLDNAWKWCRSTIRVEAKYDAENLLVSVEDDGPGIDPANAEELLGRGVRADETVPGHGLGLAMVRDIVDSYQGDINIDNSSLGGAKILITLPGTHAG
jgi:two-component system sensor histidine kinase PhoQ